MASPARIKEFRYRVTANASQNFADGKGPNWNILDLNAVKLRITDFDDSGLARDGIADEAIQTRMMHRPASIPGLSRGKVKFSYYAGASNVTNLTPFEARIVNVFLGGITQCMNARNGPVVAAGTDVNCIGFASANSHAYAGQAVLVGKKGDGRGNGEVKPVVGSNTTHVFLGICCNAAPIVSDPIAFSTTCFVDETAAQTYMDIYSIGHATADHRQAIGGVGTLKMKDLGSGQLPKFEVDYECIDHQWVPSANRATMNHSYKPWGNDPPFSKGIGSVQITDYGSNVRAVFRAGDLAVDPGIAYEPIPNPSGVNGVDGFQKVPTSPTFEATLLTDEDMPGLDSDFSGQTLKQIVFQFGCDVGKCLAIEYPRACLDAAPVSATMGNLHAVKLKGHGLEEYNVVAASAGGVTAMKSAPCRIHWF